MPLLQYSDTQKIVNISFLQGIFELENNYGRNALLGGQINPQENNSFLNHLFNV